MARPSFKTMKSEIDFTASPSDTDIIDDNDSEYTFSKGKIVKIPLDHLMVKENIRKHFDPDALQELADSIKSEGLGQPIIVYENSEKKGYYYIKTGERRYRACGIAGLVSAECVIREPPKDDIDRIVFQAVENEQRENVSSVERENYISALEKLGLQRAEIARRLHKTKSWVTEACAAHDIRENTPVLKKLETSPSTRSVYEAGKLTSEEINAAVDEANKANKENAEGKKKTFADIVHKKLTDKKASEKSIDDGPDAAEEEAGEDSSAFDIGLDSPDGELVTHSEITVRIDCASDKMVSVHATANAEDREELEKVIYAFFEKRGYSKL